MTQSNIFNDKKIVKDESKRPLADLMRPETLEDFVGQEKLVGKGGPISKMIKSDDLVSMVFWGPPGCGKTTLAKIIAKDTKSYFVEMSAVSSGKADVKKVIDSAKDIYQAYDGRRTILFLDEIHRFNKAQQDFLLPYVEDGTLILIGATTENPSFEVNSALLSRMRVYVFKRLTEVEIQKIVKRAIELAEEGIKRQESRIKIRKDALDYLVKMANGDSRAALNTLELAIKLAL